MVKLSGLAALGAAMVNPDGSAVLDDAAAAATSTGACPITKPNIDQQWLKFHSDYTCNKVGFNKLKNMIDRHGTHRYLQETGNHVKIPDVKTVFCPAVVADLKSPDDEPAFDTSWIVENTSSSPVVVSYVNKDGIEVSAINSKLSALSDPDAILKPGRWTAINTHNGHVFHVRELLEDGSPGKIVLQHRVGLIPVGDKKGRSLVCPDVDDEPIVTLEDGTKQTDPNFRRTKGPDVRDCNTLDIGFRNAAGCPLHGYYVLPDTCVEKFKFHLGVRLDDQVDFMKGWSSVTKYESTMIGHTFQFRSAFSDQVVDQITIQPTRVTDCPDLKTQVVTASVAAADVIWIPSANRNGAGSNASNNTTTATLTDPSTAASARGFSSFGSF